jgi:tRNA (guanine37-N1)-methyltransferase
VRFDVVTLFPSMLAAVTDYGVTSRAMEAGLAEVVAWDPRERTTDRHRTVDDRPYGGGPGMVMQTGPLAATLADARAADPRPAKVIHLSPQGQVLNQAALERFAAEPRLILLATRYEGVDERLIETEVDEEWSLGDYVISGGELGAMVVIDGVTRLLPGALGHTESAVQDSFTAGLLDHPHYTRPEQALGREVPAVLRSGDHAAIERWRLKQALGRTWQRRPELLERRGLSDEERALLAEYRREQGEHE